MCVDWFGGPVFAALILDTWSSLSYFDIVPYLVFSPVPLYNMEELTRHLRLKAHNHFPPKEAGIVTNVLSVPPLKRNRSINESE